MLLGFDIGGTKCAVVIGTTKGDEIEITAKEVMPTNLPVYQMIELLFTTAENILFSHFHYRDIIPAGQVWRR